jgi:hypothetical protein
MYLGQVPYTKGAHLESLMLALFRHWDTASGFQQLLSQLTDSPDSTSILPLFFAALACIQHRTRS